MRFFLVLSFVFAMCSYVYFSVLRALEPESLRLLILIVLSFFFLALLWMPLFYWREEKKRHPVIEQLMLYSAYSGMTIMSFTLAGALFKDLILLIARESPWHSSSGSWVVLLGTAACAGIGFWNATQNLKIKKVNVIDSSLPEAFNGMKIIQISDLHVGPTIRKKYVDHVVALANSEEPDLVCLTGDLIDGEVKDLWAEIEPLKNISAKLGKFYVLGNHEYYWDAMGWRDALEKLGFQPLLNQSAVVTVDVPLSQGLSLGNVDASPGGSQKIHILGLTDPAAAGFKLEKPNFEKALAGVPAGDFKILLVHQPQYYKTAATLPIQLQLSGHTHGGQFFPWTFIAARVHRFNAGLHRTQNLQVYVSRGTGYWGPPIRLGAPSEITSLVLRRK